MWAWIFDDPGVGDDWSTKMRTDYGWSGTLSLPRVLTLGPDGALRMNPPEEIERLRYNARERTDLFVEADTERVVEGIGGNSMELCVEIHAPGARQFGVKICCSPEGDEQTLVFYDA
jgi:beta-fructofuranosidase